MLKLRSSYWFGMGKMFTLIWFVYDRQLSVKTTSCRAGLNTIEKLTLFERWELFATMKLYRKLLLILEV